MQNWGSEVFQSIKHTNINSSISAFIKVLVSMEAKRNKPISILDIVCILLISINDLL